VAAVERAVQRCVTAIKPSTRHGVARCMAGFRQGRKTAEGKAPLRPEPIRGLPDSERGRHEATM
jgi:hypothetical protein